MQERGALRVGLVAKDIPPLLVTGSDGQPAGIEVAMANGLARRLGVKLQFVRTAATHDELVAQVAAGEVDIAVSSVSRTVERAQAVRFSRPYLTQSVAVALNRVRALQENVACPNTPADAAALAARPGGLGVTRGGAYEQALRNQDKKINPVVFDTVSGTPRRPGNRQATRRSGRRDRVAPVVRPAPGGSYQAQALPGGRAEGPDRHCRAARRTQSRRMDRCRSGQRRPAAEAQRHLHPRNGLELLSGELVPVADISRFHSITLSGLCPVRLRHHFIVMVIKAKLAETSTPSLAPRSSSTTPFSLRNLTPETPAATAAPPPTPV